MSKASLYRPMLLPMLLAVVPWLCTAQDMALQVIGSSGGTSASGNHSLSWTVGETIIQGTSQGNDYLGAGFQQARKPKVTVGVFQPFVPTVNIKAYPNPAGDFLTVESDAQGLTLRLFDLLGRQVLADARLNGMEQLQLTQLPAGSYFLMVFDRQGRLASMAKVQHYDQ